MSCCDYCKKRELDEFRRDAVPDMSPLENHLYSILLIISNMVETDPRASILAEKSIEPGRLWPLLHRGGDE